MKQPFTYYKPMVQSAVPKPQSLGRMLAAAEILGRDLDFVRVDFYEIDGRAIFGEMTLFPESGLASFDPLIGICVSVNFGTPHGKIERAIMGGYRIPLRCCHWPFATLFWRNVTGGHLVGHRIFSLRLRACSHPPSLHRARCCSPRQCWCCGQAETVLPEC